MTLVQAGGEGEPTLAKFADGYFVVKIPGPPSNPSVCDSLALFTIDNLQVKLSQTPEDGVTPKFTDVRIVNVVGTNSPTGMRYGSGAFCLWAADYTPSYDRTYKVTVQAWDAAHHTLYQGDVKIKIQCGPVDLDSGDTTVPADHILSGDSCSLDVNATPTGQCFADIPVPAGVCEPAGGSDCIPSENNDCGGSGGGSGTDPGGSDGGSTCIPSENNPCNGSSADGSTGSATDGSGPISDPVSGTGSSQGTAKGSGCSAFPFTDPSAGALALLGLGLLRRRRNQKR